MAGTDMVWRNYVTLTLCILLRANAVVKYTFDRQDVRRTYTPAFRLLTEAILMFFCPQEATHCTGWGGVKFGAEKCGRLLQDKSHPYRLRGNAVIAKTVCSFSKFGEINALQRRIPCAILTKFSDFVDRTWLIQVLNLVGFTQLVPKLWGSTFRCVFREIFSAL